MADVKNSTEEWRAIARGPRVFHHIHTWPERSEEWSEEEFYALGVSDWEDFRRHWTHYRPELGGTCVEIGCGAGRMTRVIAQDFERVIGLDVSEDMLALARGAVPDNVDLVQVDGPAWPLEDASADAVFSVHVLQHLDDAEAVRQSLAETYRVLRPGGTFAIHIITGQPLQGVARRARAGLRLWWNRRRLEKGEEHKAVRFRIYSYEEIRAMLFGIGFSDLELRVFPVRTNGAMHSFWFGTRQSSAE